MQASNIGKSCPYCQFPLKSDSEVYVCAECGIPHHRECWQENGGCTTFGCQSVLHSARGGRGQANDILVVDLDDDRYQFNGSNRNYSSGPQKLSRSFYLWSVGLGYLGGTFFLALGLNIYFDGLEIGLTYIIMSILLILYSVVVNMVFLYKIWEAIQDGNVQISPGKAVGFMFIPFFNLYWIFPAYWGFAKELNKYIKRKGLKLTPISEGLFLAYAIFSLCTLLISYLGIVTMILNLCIINAACNRINELADM